MRFHLVFALNICFLLNVFSKVRNFVFIWESFNCTANDKYVAESSCSIEGQVSRFLNADIMFVKDISNVKVTLSTFLPQAGSGQDAFQHFVDFNINLCNFLSGNIRSKLVANIYDSFKKFSNLPRSCPLLKDTRYLVTNLTLDGSKLPVYVPETKFRLTGNIFIANKGTILFVAIEGRIVDAKNINKV